jgi:hypothetical protein
MMGDLLSELVERHGQEVSRAQARAVLKETWDLTGDTLDAFLQAFDQIPGMKKLSKGRYRLPLNAEIWARNRGWKFGLGSVDLEDAVWLATVLEGKATAARRLPVAPDGIQRIYGRLVKALDSLGLNWRDES